MRILKIFSALSTFFLSVTLYSQHNTSSPYSMFGLGEPETKFYGQNSGMASAGIGLYEYGFLNSANPASMAIDSLSVIFDVSAAMRISSFAGSDQINRATNTNLKKISLGLRVFSKLNVNAGLLPYSNVQYKIKTTGYTEGESTEYDILHEGNGGMSRIFVSGSYKILPELMLGARASYIFGDINISENAFSSYGSTTTMTGNKLFFDFGLMYVKKLNENNEFSVGAVYGYKTDVTLSRQRFISIGNVTETMTPQVEYIPFFAGGGLALKNISGRRYNTFAVDYKFTGRANLPKPSAVGVYYANAHRINGGLKIVPNYRTPRNYFQRAGYQLGGYYELSGLKINGNIMKEYGVTIGSEFPLKKMSNFFISIDLGQRSGKNLIRENFVMFTIGASLNESWFVKWVYE